MQSNTSEVQLTIDVTRFLQERPDVQTIVVVTGDRPFLPLVRSIREEGRRALVAAVNPPQTDRYQESDLYLDARNLLSADSRKDLMANAPENGREYDRAQSPGTQRYNAVSNPVARRAIAITEAHFGQYEEVYLTPLLRKLSEILGPDRDPKALVSELEAAGAVRLEKRSGYPYDYTVLIVHDDHPDVQEIREEGVSGEAVGAAPPQTNGTDDAEPTETTAADTEADDEAAYESYDYDEYTMDEALSEDGPDTGSSGDADAIDETDSAT
jgi:hypothetical protein